MDIPARIEPSPASTARARRSLVRLAGIGLAVVVLLVALEFLRRQGVDLGTWSANIWVLIAAIPAPFVALALAFKAAEVSLNAFAWTTVLRAAFPEQIFSFRQTLGVVQGGVGIFAVVPPKFGGFAVLGLYRLAFPAIPIAAVLATRIVQGAASTILGTVLFLAFTVMTAGIGDQPGYLDAIAAFFESQPLLAVIVTGAVIALLSIVAHQSRTWVRAFAHQITVGGAILKTPRRYLGRVVLPTLLAFVFRWCVTATLLAAFLIPLSWPTLLKVNVSHGLARSVQVTPGGIGTTQAFDLAMLQGIAPVERIIAYSLSESALLFIFNLAFALGALLWAFGWDRTARFLRLPVRQAS